MCLIFSGVDIRTRINDADPGSKNQTKSLETDIKNQQIIIFLKIEITLLFKGSRKKVLFFVAPPLRPLPPPPRLSGHRNFLGAAAPL